MARLAEALRQHQLVGLDTSVFIYHLEATGPLAGVAGEALAELERGSYRGITSAVALMELWVRPIALGRPDIARDYDILLGSYPNLTAADVDRDVAWRAAELRASYRLRTPDAIQVATSLVAGATAFLTNDRDLRRVQELQVLLLEDFVEI